MEYKILRLSNENKHLIENFACVEERDNMNFPYTTVPAIKVARLAVDIKNRGKGLGFEALQFAIFVSQVVRDYSGVVFLTLDCYEHKVKYYEKFGFQRNLYQPLVLNYDSPVSMRLWIDNYLAAQGENN